MVLESLFTPQTAERRPWEMFFMGLLYASVGIFLSIWIFKEHASLVMVFLTVLACVPLMYNTIRYEVNKDLVKGKNILIKEHGRAISFFVFLFMGFVVAYSIWYILLPKELMVNTFSIQTDTIKVINQQISGNTYATSVLSQILFNNFKVLFFCILFAFFYGAGAIFILTWNASVIAAAVGNFVRNDIAVAAKYAGLFKIWNYFQIFSLGLLRYFIHGIPEITAYFVGGLAGSIISVAVIRHEFMSDNFKKVVKDSFHLIGLAAILLLIAGFMEVYVTPMFF